MVLWTLSALPSLVRQKAHFHWPLLLDTRANFLKNAPPKMQTEQQNIGMNPQEAVHCWRKNIKESFIKISDHQFSDSEEEWNCAENQLYDSWTIQPPEVLAQLMAVLVTTCHQKLGAGGGASPSVRQSAGPVQAPDKSALMSDSTGWLLANAAVVPQAPVVTLHQMEEGRTSRAPWKFFRPQCRCASGLRKDGCCGCCLSSNSGESKGSA